ncbi:hypothetical protein FGE12_23135 [Aggregicoccus sp. 17bor-14]|uniref:hypothetical protein n=1 Tax=Myxococcaceae TaxID=31 RepID=UPI00129C5643|nr:MULTISPECIES: hypothetical protein [Myxococcaceae]MBF5045318.1 hypothetical protein [Simulacricoccus sp. 17bor-14]MRI91060.1 hypothetical protein [Aggregicoccus sp. 17bor-14]
MRPSLHALAFALLLLAGAAAHAEVKVEFEAPVNLFLDRSLILFSPTPIRRYGDPQSPSPLLFEAQVAPNLFFPQLSAGDIRKPSGEWVFTAILTPHITLRMLNEKSSPVIPPSFMPKVTFQFLRLRLLDPTPGGHRRALALGAHVIVGHYSNGQAGCFFASQAGTDPDCTPEDGEPPLNETAGDFSTNFVRWELHGRLAFDLDGASMTGWVVGGHAGFERNLSIGPGGITEQIRGVYGDSHADVALLGERLWSGHRLHLEATLSRPFGGVEGQGPTVRVEALAAPHWAAGFGLYARYVGGRDYYNILFLEPVHLWQFGLSFELGPGARLREAVTQHASNHP